MLVLAIGDLHVPERATDIPARFKKLLQPTGRIQQVLCLGNTTSSPSTLEFLKSIALDFQMVKGEFDNDLNLPLSLIFNYDKLKIGLINGFQIMPKTDPLSLLTQARMMDVDILIYGSTHKVEAYTLDGKFFVNPGSATGAFSSGRMDSEDIETIENILNERGVTSSSEISENTTVEDNTTENSISDIKNPETETETETKLSHVEITKDNEPVQTNTSEDPSNEDHQLTSVEVTESTEDQVTSEEKEISKSTLNGDNNKLATPTDDDLDDEDINVDDIEDYIDPIPSFCLLDIQGSVCTLYLYTLIDGEVKVDKLTYRKEESASSSSSDTGGK